MRKIFILFVALFVISCTHKSSYKVDPYEETKAHYDALDDNENVESKSDDDEDQFEPEYEYEESELKKTEGTYYCKESKEKYVFKSDHTGLFYPLGMSNAYEFTWKERRQKITITFSSFGDTELGIDKQRGMIFETNDRGLFSYVKVKSKK